ncbi:hypothetical protein D043_1822B, partial [Vibrio parahaemolyticus EKP-021]
LTIA